MNETNVENVPASPAEPATSAQQKPKKSHKIGLIIAIFLFVTIGAGVVIGLVFSQTVMDFFYGLGYEPTDEMAQVIKNVGFTSKADFIMRSTRPSFESADAFNEYCPSESDDISTLGCYSSFDNRIYIYDIQDEELNGVKESILEHEVLHAIYERMGLGEKEKINVELDKFYQDHKDSFGTYMDSYTEDTYYTELHSIIGQRIHYADLSSVLQEHYAQYFVDYDKTVGYYDSYHSKLDELDKEVSALSDEIDSLHEDIEKRIAQYDADLEQLNRDIDYHNAQANKGNWSQSRYDSLTRRSNQIDIDRDNLNADIEKYNAKVEEFNSLLDSRSHLYSLLDSKYQKKTETFLEEETSD